MPRSDELPHLVFLRGENPYRRRRRSSFATSTPCGLVPGMAPAQFLPIAGIPRMWSLPFEAMAPTKALVKRFEAIAAGH